MNAKQRLVIRELVDFLPIFEAGEPLSSKNGAFMYFYGLVIDEFQADYDKVMERMTDLDFIAKGSLKDVRAVLNAACRSEYFNITADGSAWRYYNDCGTFRAALRRLAELVEKPT